jgi:hypothetical protein
MPRRSPYRFRCAACGKLFRRRQPWAVLGPHTTRFGLPCPGSGWPGVLVPL